jgi:hypothetical protein
MLPSREQLTNHIAHCNKEDLKVGGHGGGLNYVLILATDRNSFTFSFFKKLIKTLRISLLHRTFRPYRIDVI